MDEPLLERVREALRAVADPQTGQDIVSAGLVRGLTAKDGRVGFTLETDAERATSLERVRAAAEAAAAAAPGVRHVTAVLTAHAPEGAPAGSVRLRKGAPPEPAPGRAAPRASAATRLEGVGQVLAVASGKGGVGKSTLAVNLACALARAGQRVGLLDADVYGPSAPLMMGMLEASPQQRPDGKLEPPVAHGVKVMSIGFLVDAEEAMVWRGPIVMSTLTQMLSDVAWAPLDVLVIDLPPGTGDAQLTIVQRASVTGAVIISTPQEAALADVRRGAAMFRTTHVPILGVVENMSAATHPATGEVFAPFGAGGAREAAAKLDAPYLGALPLDAAIAAACDAGRPLAACAPETPAGQAFIHIGEAVLAGLNAAPARPAPRIVFA